MKMRGTLSGLSAGLGRRLVSSTAYAVVVVVVLLCLNVLSTRAWFRCWGQLPSPGVEAVQVKTDSCAHGTSQQASAAEGFWGDWMEVADSGASGVVKPRQMTEAENAFALNAPGAHIIASPGIRGISPHLVSRYTYSISDSDSYTMYLPLVTNGYTHPFLNGDFEIVDGDFARYWERAGDLNVSITSELSNGELCHSGTYCALLGSSDYPCARVPLGYGRVCQTFGVPSAGVSNLSFYYRIFSYDECKEGRFDCLEAYIDDVLNEAPPILFLREGAWMGGTAVKRMT